MRVHLALERITEEILMENLLSVEEAARRLGGLSKATIAVWLSQGKLARTKVGRRTMIRESELLRVIEDGGKSPAPPRKLRSAPKAAVTATDEAVAGGQ